MPNLYAFFSHLPPLNEIEEIVLARTVENGILANRELKNGNVDPKRIHLLTSEIEKAIEARNHLVLSNLGLVIRIAKLYLHMGVGLQDLIQEGTLGLIRAAGWFDYSKGTRFSTHASGYIHESIFKSLIYQSRLIRLPVHIENQLISLLRTKQSLTQKLGRFRNIAELAEATNMPEEKVAKLISQPFLCYSLEAIFECNDYDLQKTIFEEENFLLPSIRVDSYFQRRYVDSILASLPEIQSIILKYKFGMIDGFIYTYSEISQILNLPYGKVKHYADSALVKLSKIVSHEEVSDHYLD